MDINAVVSGVLLAYFKMLDYIPNNMALIAQYIYIYTKYTE